MMNRGNKPSARSGRTGLVMTAGGARGAYQAGVLKRIGEIPALRSRNSPFEIIAGASCGAINGALIAGFSDDLHRGGARLADLWGRLDAAQVYHTGGVALLCGATRLVAAATIGRWIGAYGLSSLLDTAPLRRRLSRDLPLAGIADGIGKRRLYALAVSATSYRTGQSHTFIQGRVGHPLWHKPGQIALSTRITVDHIHASSAIPVVFPPVALDVDGRRAWFGDGALRVATPLSPAVHLGADRILAIGIGSRHSLIRRTGIEPADDGDASGNVPRPSLAQICGVTLNALFLDHLDSDLAHLMRMNDQLRAYRRRRGPEAAPLDVSQPMRIIHPLTFSPSEDLAEIASVHERRMPRGVRLALDTFGAAGVQGADLISYLLFDGAYTRELIDLGYHDADARCDEIEAFLLAPRAAPEADPDV